MKTPPKSRKTRKGSSLQRMVRGFSPNAIEASATNPGQWVQLYIRSEVRVESGGRTMRWKVSRRDWQAIRRLVWRLNMVAAGHEGRAKQAPKLKLTDAVKTPPRTKAATKADRGTKNAKGVRVQRVDGRAGRTETKQVRWWQVEWLNSTNTWQLIVPRHPNETDAVKALRRIERGPTWNDTRLRVVGVEVVERTMIVEEVQVGSPIGRDERQPPGE